VKSCIVPGGSGPGAPDPEASASPASWIIRPWQYLCNDTRFFSVAGRRFGTHCLIRCVITDLAVESKRFGGTWKRTSLPDTRDERISHRFTESRYKNWHLLTYPHYVLQFCCLSSYIRFVHIYYSKTPHGIKGIGATIRFKLLGEIIFPDIISMGKRL